MVFGGSKITLAMDPEQQVGGSSGTPAMLLVLLDGRAKRHATVVPRLFWRRWIHFHRFLHIWWIQLHVFHGVWQKDKPVLAQDCPNGMPSIRNVFSPGCQTRGSSSSTSRSHATVGLIFMHGSDAAVWFTAITGSWTVLWTIGMPLLHAWSLTFLPLPHITIAPTGRPRPPVAVCLRGRPLPRIVAVPMVPLKSVCGLGARGPLGTGV